MLVGRLRRVADSLGAGEVLTGCDVQSELSGLGEFAYMQQSELVAQHRHFQVLYAERAAFAADVPRQMPRDCRLSRAIEVARLAMLKRT